MRISLTRSPNQRQRLSCTTNGINVVQDDRALNRLDRLKPLFIGEIDLHQGGRSWPLFVSQDQEFPVLRWGESIAYGGGDSAIGFTDLQLSCTTNGVYVVQDNRALNRLDYLKALSIEEINLNQADRSWLLFGSQDQESSVLRRGESIVYRGGNSAIGFTDLQLSCTTNGINVVQDKRTLNRLNPLKSLSVGEIDLHQADRSWLLFMSQDWEFPVLRWGESIAYRGGNSVIEFTDLQLSCTTNRIYVVQDQGGYDAS